MNYYFILQVVCPCKIADSARWSAMNLLIIIKCYPLSFKYQWREKQRRGRFEIERTNLIQCKLLQRERKLLSALIIHIHLLLYICYVLVSASFVYVGLWKRFPCDLCEFFVVDSSSLFSWCVPVFFMLYVVLMYMWNCKVVKAGRWIGFESAGAWSIIGEIELRMGS